MMTRAKNLNEKAMLVDMTISIWTGRTKDSMVSNEVRSAKNADVDAGAWWTYLIPKKNLHPIMNAQGKIRTAFRNMTLPWNDAGMRILPAKMFDEYTKVIREHKEYFNEVVEEFLKEYPEIKRNAKKRLGKLAENKDIPTVEQIRSRFGIRTTILPLPSSGDFRVDLGDVDTKAIKKQIEATMNATMKTAMSDIWNRLTDLVGKIESTMKDEKKVFRGSLISNLTDFCELIPKLNVTDSDELEKMRSLVVNKLGKLSPDDVRGNAIVRQKAAKDAKAVLNKMKAFKF